jgi:hypothetical protein
MPGIESRARESENVRTRVSTPPRASVRPSFDSLPLHFPSLPFSQRKLRRIVRKIRRAHDNHRLSCVALRFLFCSLPRWFCPLRSRLRADAEGGDRDGPEIRTAGDVAPIVIFHPLPGPATAPVRRIAWRGQRDGALLLLCGSKAGRARCNTTPTHDEARMTHRPRGRLRSRTRSRRARRDRAQSTHAPAPMALVSHESAAHLQCASLRNSRVRSCTCAPRRSTFARGDHRKRTGHPVSRPAGLDPPATTARPRRTVASATA